MPLGSNPYDARYVLMNLAAARSRASNPPAEGRAAEAPSEPYGQTLVARGLVFEIENVLYDCTLWRRWLARLLAHMGIQADYRTFYRAWDEDFLPSVHSGRREFAEAFQAFLLQSGLSWGQIDEIEAASRIWRPTLDCHPRPLPQVTATLTVLAATGVSMVVLANSIHSADVLCERLEQLKLRRFFSCVLSSLDLEMAKPSAQCYASALAASGCCASETVYVGYDPACLAGAAAVGLQTVACNGEATVEADVRLERFDHLPRVLECRESEPLRRAA